MREARMKLPNLESLLARRNSSAAAWFSEVFANGGGGFTISLISAHVSDPDAPFLTLGVLSHSAASVVISLNVRNDLLTMQVRLMDDGHVDFMPTSVCLKDGTSPPEGMEPVVRHIDDFLGKIDLAKEEFIPQ